MFKTQSQSEFKRDFLKCNNVVTKLNALKFDFNLMWSRNPKSPFEGFRNNSKAIKQSKRYKNKFKIYIHNVYAHISLCVSSYD